MNPRVQEAKPVIRGAAAGSVDDTSEFLHSRQEEKGMMEDEMVGWHEFGHEFE